MADCRAEADHRAEELVEELLGPTGIVSQCDCYSENEEFSLSRIQEWVFVILGKGNEELSRSKLRNVLERFVSDYEQSVGRPGFPTFDSQSCKDIVECLKNRRQKQRSVFNKEHREAELEHNRGVRLPRSEFPASAYFWKKDKARPLRLDSRAEGRGRCCSGLRWIRDGQEQDYVAIDHAFVEFAKKLYELQTSVGNEGTVLFTKFSDEVSQSLGVQNAQKLVKYFSKNHKIRNWKDIRIRLIHESHPEVGGEDPIRSHRGRQAAASHSKGGVAQVSGAIDRSYADAVRRPPLRASTSGQLGQQHRTEADPGAAARLSTARESTAGGTGQQQQQQRARAGVPSSDPRTPTAGGTNQQQRAGVGLRAAARPVPMRLPTISEEVEPAPTSPRAARASGPIFERIGNRKTVNQVRNEILNLRTPDNQEFVNVVAANVTEMPQEWADEVALTNFYILQKVKIGSGILVNTPRAEAIFANNIMNIAQKGGPNAALETAMYLDSIGFGERNATKALFENQVASMRHAIDGPAAPFLDQNSRAGFIQSASVMETQLRASSVAAPRDASTSTKPSFQPEDVIKNQALRSRLLKISDDLSDEDPYFQRAKMVWHQYDKNYEPKSIEEMASAGCLYKYDDFVFHYYMGGGACGMTFLVSPKNHPDMVAVMKREESEDGQVKSVFRSLCVHGEMSEFRGVTRLLGYFVEDSPLEGHFVTFTIMEAGDIDLKRALETPMYRNLEPQTQYRVLSRIYNKIAKAVAKFHERSIVHRDLKDQNVVLVLNRDDPVDLLLAEPKIVDWAFSRKTGVLQSACGTPTTQAPEAAALGQDVTTKSDVYSFGAMLFASISGTALCFHYFPHFYLYGRTFTDGQGRMLRNGDLCDQHNECRDFSAEAWWPNGDFGSHAARIVRECIRLNANHRIDVQELIRAMDNLVQVADTETVG